ncbi:hypothetical protein [Halobaculum lipolyticum]|uniref:Uncharacterized protein n=1 Tax=Halobaculum lipolyticum TaxID=3032001 RepID=A0ABD5WDV3_9EURY|nr:hypothetical protein [Halobaculum sp. DT31]
MGLGEREACGRCSMTTVVDATDDGERDPYGDDRIELADDDLRRVSPSAWLGGAVSRLDDLATRLTYGDK